MLTYAYLLNCNQSINAAKKALIIIAVVAVRLRFCYYKVACSDRITLAF